MASRFATITAVMTTLLLARGAHADDQAANEAEAKKLSARATALATAGFGDGDDERDNDKIKQAIALFKEAFALDPNPIYQCNAGSTYAAIEDLPRAHALLTQCLVRLPAVKASAVGAYRGELDSVEAALPRRHVAVDVITAPAGATLSVSTLAEDERLVAPTVVWLPVGTHSIAATANGYQRVTQEVSIAAVDISSQTKKRVRLALTEEVRAPTTVAEPIVIDQPAPRRRKDRRKAAKIFLGAGVLLAAGGGVAHVLGLRTKNQIGDELDLPEEAGLRDKLELQEAITIGLYSAGGAALITGAVLYYLSPRHADRVAITPPPSGDGAVVWLDLSP